MCVRVGSRFYTRQDMEAALAGSGLSQDQIAAILAAHQQGLAAAREERVATETRLQAACEQLRGQLSAAETELASSRELHAEIASARADKAALEERLRQAELSVAREAAAPRARSALHAPAPSRSAAPRAEVTTRALRKRTSNFWFCRQPVLAHVV